MNRRDHYFIYTYDEKNKRTGHIICVMIKDGMIFHGVALCNSKDQFNKKVGRELAKKRAEERYQRYLFRLNSLNDDGN